MRGAFATTAAGTAFALAVGAGAGCPPPGPGGADSGASDADAGASDGDAGVDAGAGDAGADTGATGPVSYLDNGTIRVGVHLEKGGSITYLAADGGSNIINSFDLGREVQQSYYSGPASYGETQPPWSPWPWNPTGAGDWLNHPSEVLEHRNDGQEIYLRNIPKQWALDNVPCECTFEHWITLSGNSVHLRLRLNNARSDTTQYAYPWTQELPAIYTIGKLYRLVTYVGDAPYTLAPTAEIALPEPPTLLEWSATEHWSALVNATNWGLGVIHPEAVLLAGFFHGTPGRGGPRDDDTGYMAPHLREVIDHDIQYEYEVDLVLGTVDEIRAFAYARRGPSRPSYRFVRDRRHFTFVNAADDGWPIEGALRIHVDQTDPYVNGPEEWWKASEVPTLYVRAAFHTVQNVAELFWSAPPGQSWSAERSLKFTVETDGQFHTYAVDLSASQHYTGTITGVRFDPIFLGEQGGRVELESITSDSP